MDITGKIIVITPIEKFNNDFYKREIVVMTDEQYPSPVKIEFLKAKADLIENYSVGDQVTVSINVGGRAWEAPDGETKYFNSITGWKIEKIPLAAGMPQGDGNDDFVFDN